MQLLPRVPASSPLTRTWTRFQFEIGPYRYQNGSRAGPCHGGSEFCRQALVPLALNKKCTHRFCRRTHHDRTCTYLSRAARSRPASRGASPRACDSRSVESSRPVTVEGGPGFSRSSMRSPLCADCHRRWSTQDLDQNRQSIGLYPISRLRDSVSSEL